MVSLKSAQLFCERCASRRPLGVVGRTARHFLFDRDSTGIPTYSQELRDPAGTRSLTTIRLERSPPPPSGRGRARADSVSAWPYVSIQTKERYLGCKRKIHNAVNDRIGLEQSKSAVLNNLASPSSQRTYHAITGHSVWSTTFIRSSFIRPPCTSTVAQLCDHFEQQELATQWDLLAGYKYFQRHSCSCGVNVFGYRLNAIACVAPTLLRFFLTDRSVLITGIVFMV
jgi:hypothetical protein